MGSDCSVIRGVRVEHPRLRLPVYLVIDDGVALCLRDLITWDNEAVPNLVEERLAENQYRGETRYGESERFMNAFIDVIHRNGIKGKLSILPYVPGVGMMDNIPECPEKPLVERFVNSVRTDVMGAFDITPEIITHDKAYDLKSGTFLDEKEWKWCDKQSEQTLTEYLTFALRVLRNVGLEPNGVTSPCDFAARVEDKYVAAVRNSVREVCGSSFAWYFLSFATDGFPKLMRFDRLRKEAVSSVVCVTGDISMRTRYGNDVHAHADACLGADGVGGYLRGLIDKGSPLPLCMHWWLMYANGALTGLRVLDEVAKRLNSLYGDSVRWMKCSEVAKYYTVAKTCLIGYTAADTGSRLTFDSPFSCEDLTIGFDCEKPARSIERLGEGGERRQLRRVERRRDLRAETWLVENGRVFACFDIENKVILDVVE